MTLRLGDRAPDFLADSTHGPLAFHAWKAGRWALIFSHPRDFTPVCTTELARAAALAEAFARRDCLLVGLSVDTLASHQRWARDIAAVGGRPVPFPLVADAERRIAVRYGMLPAGPPGTAGETATVRSVFVIGPDDRVRLTLTYPASVGRSFDELLRVVDALQLTSEYAVATPVDWRPGDDVVVAPTVSDADAASRFPGYVAVTPYLRLARQPG